MSEGSGCGSAPGCAILILLVAIGGFRGLYGVGEGAHWTSDGPGMLLVWLGLLGCVLVGLSAVGALAAHWIAPHLPPWLRDLLRILSI